MRLNNLIIHLSKKSVLKLVDGLFTSKVRYGLQLLGNVRCNNSDPTCANLHAIQLVQSKLLRFLNGTKVSDKVTTVSMLKKFNMLAVNQMNAQSKLLEVWKALNVPKYPLSIKQQSRNHEGVSTRADSKQRPCDVGRSTITKKDMHQWCSKDLEPSPGNNITMLICIPGKISDKNLCKKPANLT